MRQPRLKAPADHPRAYYHCLSRVVNREFVFGPAEREQFVTLLREYEAFCGLRVLTFCVLSNHFHLLLEVPRPPDPPLAADQLLRHLDALSSTTLPAAEARRVIAEIRARGDLQAEQQFCNRWSALMYDVSSFMKLLKQRFTQWFNRRHDRRGTLWEERFRSVLVEDGGEAVAAVAAYIDLNPVRAGLVADPKDYRWCGYAEAVAGLPRAGDCLQQLLAVAYRVAPETLGPRREVLENYRRWLFGQGEERAGVDSSGQPLRKGFRREELLAVLQARGRLTAPEYLHLRVRYFTDGAVLGSRAYVDSIFTAFRRRFGAGRRSGARRLRGVANEWFALRNLRLRVFG